MCVCAGTQVSPVTPCISMVHLVPPLTSNFWEVVAKRMEGGHSADECQTVYHQLSEEKTKRVKNRKQQEGEQGSKTGKHCQ